MKYYLMHKDYKAAVLEINTEYGIIEKISTLQKELLPLCAQSKVLNDPTEIKRWWSDRAVSKNQSNVRKLLEKYGIATTEKLLLDNLALSLTDCYWVCPAEAPIHWDNVSLFKNAFTSDLYQHLQVHGRNLPDQGISHVAEIGTFTPAASTGGELEKRWERINGTIYLLKGNMPGNSFQQSLNEVFASVLHDRMGFKNHVDYRLAKLGKGSFGCISKCFTSEDVELVPAWQLLSKYKKPNNISPYVFYIECMVKEGIDKEEAKRFLDYQTATDFLLTNLDRHLNNFGILRNSDTLEAIGPAPIFDTGNSMLHTRYSEDNPLELLERNVTSLCNTETQMMGNVTSFQDIDLNLLPSSEEVINFYRQDETIGYNLSRIAETFRYKANIIRLIKDDGIPIPDIKKGISELVLSDTRLAETKNMNDYLEGKGVKAISLHAGKQEKSTQPSFGKGLTKWLRNQAEDQLVPDRENNHNKTDT